MAARADTRSRRVFRRLSPETLRAVSTVPHGPVCLAQPWRRPGYPAARAKCLRRANWERAPGRVTQRAAA